MNSSLNKRIAIGAAWMVGLRQADRLIGLISITILARLLFPEDFGLVVYATTFIAILELFFQFGFETVLIRDQDAGRDSYNTAWTLEIIKGILIAALMGVGAYPISLFFQEPAVQVVIYHLAIIPLLNGFKNIGIVEFQKKMEFDKEFTYRFSVRVISTIITIVLAFQLRSHWALIYGMIASSVLSFVLSYVMCGYRPSICLAKVSRIFGFSKWLMIQNLMYGMNERLPVLVLSRMFEARVAAIYTMGFELSNFASGEFASPIRRVLFPGVASLAGDEPKMVETIVKAVAVIAIIGLPTTIGIAVTAPIFVPFLLGENWADIIPVIQVLVINGICLVLYSNSHIIFYALDKPHLTAYITGCRLVLLFPALLILVPRYGVLGAAWALSIVNIIVTAAEYVMFFSLVALKPKVVLGVIWRSIVGAAVMGATIFSTVEWLLGKAVRMSLFSELIIAVTAGVVCYTVTVILIWLASGRPEGAESYVLNKLTGFIGRKAEAT